MSHPCWWEGTSHKLTAKQKEELHVLNEYFSNLEKPTKYLRKSKPKYDPNRFRGESGKNSSIQKSRVQKSGIQDSDFSEPSFECIQTDIPKSKTTVERRATHAEARVKNLVEYKMVFKGATAPWFPQYPPPRSKSITISNLEYSQMSSLTINSNEILQNLPSSNEIETRLQKLRTAC